MKLGTFKKVAWVPDEKLRDSYSFAYWNHRRQVASFKLTKADMLRLREWARGETQYAHLRFTEKDATELTIMDRFFVIHDMPAVCFEMQVVMMYPEHKETAYKKSGTYNLTEEAGLRLGSLFMPAQEVETGKLYLDGKDVLMALPQPSRYMNAFVTEDFRTIQVSVFKHFPLVA